MHVTKPCKMLMYCPYGSLVEDFPVANVDDECACGVFGHECPAYHVAENFVDDEEEEEE